MNQKHLLSIDLESWVFSERIKKEKLTTKQLKIIDNGYTPRTLDFLLSILSQFEQKITFFIVGKLEEMYPGIIEKILSYGHEVGWHTHTHTAIENTSILEEELDKSKRIISKYKIKGFQSPAIVFIEEGYKYLKNYGFTYSSSIYGNTNAVYKFDGIYEIPVSTSKESYKPSQNNLSFPSHMSISNMLQFGIPYGSSFFWSVLGRSYYENKLKKLTGEAKIANLFMHEWQLFKPTSVRYKKDVGFLWNPLFFPYKVEILPMFAFLLSQFKFDTFENYVKGLKP